MVIASEDNPLTAITLGFSLLVNQSATYGATDDRTLELRKLFRDVRFRRALSLAIDREVCFAGRTRTDSRVVIHSLEFGDTADFDLTALTRADHTWGEYVKGCAWVLGDAGPPLQGWEGVLGGDVPRGAAQGDAVFRVGPGDRLAKDGRLLVSRCRIEVDEAVAAFARKVCQKDR